MKKALFGLLLISFFIGGAGNAYASHSWADYHWARAANPFTLKLGDNVTSAWDTYLAQASSDWTASTVLDTTIVAGLTNPRVCKGTTGRVEVCNAAYGNNGWLGLASISIDSAHHIVKGTAKMNDTYFASGSYNTPAWRQMVMCQEVAHTFGLDHQDTNFTNTNLGTCMDYTNNPSTNQHPNQHDYDQLVTIYTHLDSYTTLTASIKQALGLARADEVQSEEWGIAVGHDASGRANEFERQVANGNKVITHVFWLPD
jgi:hypothetical protein